MGTKWGNVSLPTELIKEIADKKPSYQSVPEFIRAAVLEKLEKIRAVS